MATPVVAAAPTSAAPYAPGAALTVGWTVTDADNSTEKLVLEGVDASGNDVQVVLDIARQDTFTMTRVYWQRTNTNLAVDNANRKATGVVPTA